MVLPMMGQNELTVTIERIRELESEQAVINVELEGLKDTVKAYQGVQGSA